MSLPILTIHRQRDVCQFVEEAMVFVTRAIVEALLRHEKEKVALGVTCLNLRPPHPIIIAAKL